MEIKYGGALTDIKEERAIIKSIRKSRQTRNWQQGEEGELFEGELARYLGVNYCVLTNSGSSAGLLALSALELPKGSEVIISAVTFPTIFNIILQCGLVPVVVDAKVGTYNFEIKNVKKAITDKTRAIIAIHAVGNPVDMPALMKLVKGKGIYVIEDNCDGLGSTIGNKKVGSFGDISITSLHAAHIVSMGVGGAIFTNRKDLERKIRMYRDWGRQANTKMPSKYKELPKDQNPRFIYEKIGYNFQILDLQAAMGRVQLAKIGKTKTARLRNFFYLFSRLEKFEDLIMPAWLENASVCWFSFPITVVGGQREKLTKYLEKNGIETRSMFSGNITKHPAYKNSEFRINGKLTEANFILENSFWISCHPSLTKIELDYIIDVFKTFSWKK